MTIPFNLGTASWTFRDCAFVSEPTSRKVRLLKLYLLEMFGSGRWKRFNHLEGGHTYDYKGKDEICFSLAR